MTDTTGKIGFETVNASRAFRALWLERTGYRFEENDLNSLDGAERAEDIANQVHGVHLTISRS